MNANLRPVRTTPEAEATAPGAEGFEAFFEAHRRRLYGALTLVTGNRFEAEEIMQDAFLRVWERWDRVPRWTSRAGSCSGLP